MRNADLMIDLLEEMSNEPNGLIILVVAFESPEGAGARYHHAELLSDAGLAHWKTESAVRITNQGYDFLNAVRQGPPGLRQKFKNFLDQGRSLLVSVNDIVSIANGI